jgi:ATP-dependent Clp protease ATP-binding subunit ClpA
MNAKVYRRFNTSAVRTMQYANQAATRLRHDYIASEHILIGLIRNRGCPARQLLARLGVSRAAIVHELRKHMMSGDSLVAKRRIPIKPDARGVIGSAANCADLLSHEIIATEHILLALLSNKAGVASSAFATLGLVYDDVLGIVARDLNVTLSDAENPEP